MTQLILTPVIDTQVVSGAYAGLNFGSVPSSIIGRSQVEKNSFNYRLLLRFDLSTLPAGAVLTAATLRLRVDSHVSAVGQSFQAQRLTRSDRTELGATWNTYDGVHAWSAPGGDLDPADAATALFAAEAVHLEFSLAELAVDAVALRAGLLELAVRGPESGSTAMLTVHTSESETHEDHPRLTLNYAAPPQLHVADHGDGSGATAHLAADEDAASTVYVRTFDGELAGESWTAVASRLGSGELLMELPPGHYFGHAVSTIGPLQLVSNVVYFIVRDGAESIHARCLAAVQARIRLLGLADIDNERIVIEKVPAARHRPSGLLLPAIILSPERAAMPADAGTNGADDVHYDVLVSILDRDNQQPTQDADLDRYLLWRQQIARAFRNQRLLGVPEVINSAVEPADGPQHDAWKRELLASSLRLRFTTREIRGF